MNKFTGIKPKHTDPSLPPGEYTVDITTEGGSAVVNGCQGFTVDIPRPFCRSDEFMSYKDVVSAIEKAGGRVRWVS